MHVIVRERDTESPATGTQLEATNAHRVLINTTQRTMEITEQDGGALLVRASDLLGHPVPVRNELEAPADDANPNPQTPKEAMLRVGIQGIVSDHNHRNRLRSNPAPDSVLVDRLFSYVRTGLGDAPALVVTDDMVEYAARNAFNRKAAERGCTWDGSLNPTTEKTRAEFRDNTRTALEAALMFTAHEADGPAVPKDPAKRGWLGLGPEVERTKEDYALTEPPMGITEQLHRRRFRDSPAGKQAIRAIRTTLARHKAYDPSDLVEDLAALVLDLKPEQDAETAKEDTPPAPLKFGAFWDAMQELLINGTQHLVVFKADRNVYAAVSARGADRATPIWLVSVQQQSPDSTNQHVPLYHLSNLSSFQILGTYHHEQDVPF